MIKWYVVYYGVSIRETTSWYGSTPDKEKASSWIKELEARGLKTDIDEVIVPANDDD